MASSGSKRVRVIRQSTVSDCGLACIAMVASAYGCKISLSELRRRFRPGLRGMTVRNIVNSAEALGFSAEAVTFEIAGLKDLDLPAVLHFRGSHFVVLTKVTDGSATICDPSWGKVRYRTSELHEHLTGIAIEMRPTRRVIVGSIGKHGNPFKPLIDELRTQATTIVRLLLLSLYLEALLVTVPLLIAQLLNDFAAKPNNATTGMVAWIVMLAAIAGWALQIYRSIALSYITTHVRERFTSKVVPGLLCKSFEFFRSRTSADLQNSLSAVELLRNWVTDDLVNVLVDGVLVATTLVVIFYLSPTIAIATLGVVAVIVGSKLVVARKGASLYDGIVRSHGAESDFVQETLRGIKTIKLFGREQERCEAWKQCVRRTIGLEIRESRSEIATNSVPAAASELLVVGTILAQITLLHDSATIGTIFALFVYQKMVLDRSRAIACRVAQFNILHVYMNRMSDVMEDTSTPTTASENKPIGARWPRCGTILDVKGVCFSFDGEVAPILRDVSFSLDAGNIFAIQGRSGVGKTTLLEILLGMREADSGTVEWAGIPLREMDQKSFRRSVVAVSQDDVLFSGTIQENITFFDLAADEDRMRDAARAAMLEDDILGMPLQFETNIDNGTGGLSGGQLQRLRLARALYAQPRILVIDEGTNEIDPETEARIYSGLMRRGITVIVVAHRHETLRLAKRSYVLDSGKLSAMSAGANRMEVMSS